MAERVIVYGRNYSWHIEPKNKNGQIVLHVTSEDGDFDFIYSLGASYTNFDLAQFKQPIFVRGIVETHDWREGDEYYP